MIMIVGRILLSLLFYARYCRIKMLVLKLTNHATIERTGHYLSSCGLYLVKQNKLSFLLSNILIQDTRPFGPASIEPVFFDNFWAIFQNQDVPE